MIKILFSIDLLICLIQTFLIFIRMCYKNYIVSYKNYIVSQELPYKVCRLVPDSRNKFCNNFALPSIEHFLYL